jgi:phosphate transport system protein
MTQHTVREFDQDLQALGQRIAEMGGLAEKAVGESIEALLSLDGVLAQEVIDADRLIDRLQQEVEEKAVQTIAKRQPMAVDLREVIAALRIAGDLERVGDLAKNTAKRVMALGGRTQPPQLAGGVQHMAELVLEQLQTVLDSYAQRDAAAALEVRRRDGEVDQMYTSLFRELLTYMMEDPRNISFCTHLLFTAKNVERIGDHATNIAETVHYLVVGQPPVEERQKQDLSSSTTVPFEE